MQQTQVQTPQAVLVGPDGRPLANLSQAPALPPEDAVMIPRDPSPEDREWEWYEGGNLQSADLATFHKATVGNALATVASWLLALHELDGQQQGQSILVSMMRISNGDDLLHYTSQAVVAIIKSSQDHLEQVGHHAARELAMMAFTRLGYVRFEEAA